MHVIEFVGIVVALIALSALLLGRPHRLTPGSRDDNAPMVEARPLAGVACDDHSDSRMPDLASDSTRCGGTHD
ncbi:hypothetical protein [Lysobacter claricitrinus]|uniref:hypothetical protein n=1 Tax=Lysobacter claricitrinus TaxID=3367728 RepID=UPI0037DB52DD